jgi:hypothetical protein
VKKKPADPKKRRRSLHANDMYLTTYEVLTTPNLLNNLAPPTAGFYRLTPFFSLLLSYCCHLLVRSIG